MERMSAEPHIAGSPASKAVADYVAGLLREWGLEVPRSRSSKRCFPTPNRDLLEMTAPGEFKAKLRSRKLAEDRDSGDKDQVPTYNAYSGEWRRYRARSST